MQAIVGVSVSKVEPIYVREVLGNKTKKPFRLLFSQIVSWKQIWCSDRHHYSAKRRSSQFCSRYHCCYVWCVNWAYHSVYCHLSYSWIRINAVWCTVRAIETLTKCWIRCLVTIRPTIICLWQHVICRYIYGRKYSSYLYLGEPYVIRDIQGKVFFRKDTVRVWLVKKYLW